MGVGEGQGGGGAPPALEYLPAQNVSIISCPIFLNTFLPNISFLLAMECGTLELMSYWKSVEIFQVSVSTAVESKFIAHAWV